MVALVHQVQFVGLNREAGLARKGFGQPDNGAAGEFRKGGAGGVCRWAVSGGPVSMDVPAGIGILNKSRACGECPSRPA
ncbi:hypothetical protein DSLASN_23750 [Desulfoluna limicola]|uniref:Uncharacterized protein n=1 Tax=Desulfoluna limicola TaxID=2810562 RepID=A0ABM7PGN8_9BACT|nr:hypothetical protein DSLASN_23750 [Desulfoluna limicola]